MDARFYLGAHTDGSLLFAGFKEECSSLKWEECLCTYSGKLEGLEIGIVHSQHDDHECFEGIKRMIERNPHAHFYIFSIGKEERREEIGDHENATYIGGSKQREVMKELHTRISDSGNQF